MRTETSRRTVVPAVIEAFARTCEARGRPPAGSPTTADHGGSSRLRRVDEHRRRRSTSGRRRIPTGGVRHLTAAVAIAVCVPMVMAGCSGAAISSTDPPVLELIGDGVLRYRGPQLWVVVEYQYAATSIGSRWLLLDVGMTAVDGSSATVERDKVFVRTPSGRRIPLASQAEFSRAYNDLRAQLRRANVLQNATYSFPATRRPCRFEFYSTPGAGVVYDSVWLNDKRVCYERLPFDVPEGVVPGRWVLGIDLENGDIRIPFQL